VASTAIVGLGSSSKLNAEWSFLTKLREEGRRATDAFLAEHGDAVGTRSSLDIDRLLLEST
jgi:NTE family protein